MNTYRLILVLLVGLCTTVRSANTFINLGFEEGRRDFEPGYVPTNEVLPGWEVTMDGATQTEILFEEMPISGGNIVLAQRTNPSGRNYRLALSSGNSNPLAAQIPQISQIGRIAGDARSFEFWGMFVGGIEAVELAINQERLELISLGEKAVFAGREWTLVGADIRRFAGTDAELSITVLDSPDPLFENGLWLDALQFTGRTIPEPSVLGFLGMAGFVFLMRKRC